MTPFIFTNDDDDEESMNVPIKFISCETSDECYACTGRIILNLDLCQIEEGTDVHIADTETIQLCMECLQSMMHSSLVDISYNPVDAFSWMGFQIIALHPDSRN